jgi:hypothetical protein
MPKAGVTVSEEGRSNVSAGMRESWRRRYREGYTPKGPKGQLLAIAAVLECNPDQALDVARELVGRYKTMCGRLQECVQKHKLGLGGEQVDELVVAEVDRLRGPAVPGGPLSCWICGVVHAGWCPKRPVEVQMREMARRLPKVPHAG